MLACVGADDFEAGRTVVADAEHIAREVCRQLAAMFGDDLLETAAVDALSMLVFCIAGSIDASAALERRWLGVVMADDPVLDALTSYVGARPENRLDQFQQRTSATSHDHCAPRRAAVLQPRKADRSMTSVLHSCAGGADRFVVLDTETTGVYPSDRVVEITLITLSLNGDILDIYDTLVQPERDVSAGHIHGITASMVSAAPTFADIAGDIAVRLDGACLVAHNLPFDYRLGVVGGGFCGLEWWVLLPGSVLTARVDRSRPSRTIRSLSWHILRGAMTGLRTITTSI